MNTRSFKSIASRVLLAIITVVTVSCAITSPARAQSPSAPKATPVIDPDPIFDEEYILINKDVQTLYIIKDGKTLFQAPCGTSREYGKDVVETKNGAYSIKEKHDETYVSNQFHVPMPWAMKIYEGVMIHGSNNFITQRGEEYGLPRSHGCINLSVAKAKELSARVKVGTKVKIIGSNAYFLEKTDKHTLGLYTANSQGEYQLKVLSDPSPENIAAAQKAALEGKLLIKGPADKPEKCFVGMPHLPDSSLIPLSKFKQIVPHPNGGTWIKIKH